MGEGSERGDRSSTIRHRVNLGIEKSSSDTEIAGHRQSRHIRRRNRSHRRRSSSAKTEKKSGESKRKEREKLWPFLEGLTVDELARYRRRRIENHPRDTLLVGGDGAYYFDLAASDIIKETPLTPTPPAPLPPVSEYRRAFRAIGQDSIINVIESSCSKIARSSSTILQQRDNLPISTGEELTIEPALVVNDATESHWQPAATQLETLSSSPPPPPPPIIPIDEQQRRSAPMETTVFEKVHHRETPDNCTKPPALVSRSRDTMMTMSSQQHRREAADDEFYGHTVSSSCYVAHTGNHRAELARRPTSLKMEGNMAGGKSEQCDKFVEWFNVTRPELVRMPTNLKLEGDIETTTENHANYVPFVGARRPELLRQTAHLKLEGEQSTYLPEYTDVFRQHRHIHEKRVPVLPESHLKTGGDYYDNTENGRASENRPRRQEHREQFDAPFKRREREPNNERDVRMLVSKLEDSKGPMALLETPEYKDACKNYPRERPKLVKPGYGDTVPYCNKDNPLIPIRPEYRDTRYRPWRPSLNRRRDSCRWIDNDSGEQFGQINAANEQDAFQLVSTRVHEDSVTVGKPPLAGPCAAGSRTRRSDGASAARTAVPGCRFSSTPAANQYRGASNQRSAAVYSPSFGGKTTMSQRQQQRGINVVNSDQRDAAFVVLPNDTRTSHRTTDADLDFSFNPAPAVGNVESRKLLDRRYNNNNNNNSPGLPPARGSCGIPTNWMPPWYDNTADTHTRGIQRNEHDDADLDSGSSLGARFSRN